MKSDENENNKGYPLPSDKSGDDKKTYPLPGADGSKGGINNEPPDDDDDDRDDSKNE